jgi:hypothetical protein
VGHPIPVLLHLLHIADRISGHDRLVHVQDVAEIPSVNVFQSFGDKCSFQRRGHVSPGLDCDGTQVVQDRPLERREEGENREVIQVTVRSSQTFQRLDRRQKREGKPAGHRASTFFD